MRLLLEWQADPNTAAAPTGDLAARAHVALEQERSSGIENSTWSNRTFAILPGLTPLHAAVWIGDPEITRLLLDYRADIRASNQRGNLPDDLAIESGAFNVLPLLIVSV